MRFDEHVLTPRHHYRRFRLRRQHFFHRDALSLNVLQDQPFFLSNASYEPICAQPALQPNGLTGQTNQTSQVDIC